MSRYPFKCASFLLLCSFVLSGCWSSKEIEEKSVYVGMAVDVAKKTETEKQLEAQDGITPVDSIITATIQIVPVKSVKGNQESGGGGGEKYLNDSETGNSIFEIMRKYALRRDRAVIGHHLKVFVISTDLAKQVEISTLLDFMLRDNDIRPSCMVFLSQNTAADTLESNQPDEIPAFHMRDMVLNKYRNNEIMKPVILTNLDQHLKSKRSFTLQNIAVFERETEFAGAGIIKGETGKWIGNLTQQDVSSISWIKGESEGGLLKSVNDHNKLITYEIKSSKSKVTPQVNGDQISFNVDIRSDGRLIESWDQEDEISKVYTQVNLEQDFEEELKRQLESLIKKMQQEYKVEVAGFGERLRISHPRVWNKVKREWDEVFSRAEVNFDIKLKITDYGSSTE